MATPEEQFGQILALSGQNSKGITELKTSMSEMRALRSELNVWKPQMDNRVEELEHAVLALGKMVEKTLSNLPQAESVAGFVTIAQPPPAAVSEGHQSPPTLKMPGSAHLESSPSRAASGSLDHDKSGFGVVYTVTPDQNPVSGAKKTLKSITNALQFDGSQPCDQRPMVHAMSNFPYHTLPNCPHSALPNFPFPQFDGTNPKLWIKNGKIYFTV